MDELKRWTERLRGLFFRSRVEREVEEEMRYHIEMEARERIAGGMDPAAARRTARLEFGSVERFRAEVRDARWGRIAENLVRDLHYALRTLGRRPGFAAVVLLTLALGIGSGTAIFSLVDAVLFRPLPYGTPEDVAWIRNHWKDHPEAALSPAEYLDFRDRLTVVFSALGIYARSAANLGGDGEPQRVGSAYLTAGVLPALGVQPVRGRCFTDEEDESAAPVVLISDSLWQRRFAGAADAVGRTLTVNGRSAAVIGVLPPGFRLPDDLRSGDATQIFLPHGIDPSQVTNRGSHYAAGVARLRPGVSWTRAREAIETLAAGFSTEYPDGYPADKQFGATIVPLGDQVRGPARLPLAILAVTVTFVLLLTCANVAGLLLARADRRERELTLRTALGAGRGRLMTQVMVESLLLALAGGVLGVLVAGAAVHGLETWNPLGLAWLDDLRVDARVLGFALGITTLTGLFFGFVPALRVGRSDLAESLKDGVRSSMGSRRSQRLRRGLVVAEVAVALVLLVGAGLLVRSFLGLVAVDPGFRTERVLSTRVALPGAAYTDNEAIVAFYRELVPRLAAIPGVVSAGAVSNLPLATGLGDISFEIEGRPIPEGGYKPDADWQVVTPGYFDAMGLTLVRGRFLRADDTSESPGVAVINDSFAELHWPGNDDPIGKRFLMTADEIAPNLTTVVGVVRDVRHEGLDDRRRRPQMYFAHEQFRFWGSGSAAESMTLIVHSPLSAGELRPAIRSVVDALDPSLPLSDLRTIEEVRHASTAVPRLLMGLVLTFALVALVLATVGIYGVMATAVGQRIAELGLRLALGARPGEVMRLIFAQGARLAGGGLVLGLGAAFALTRLLRGLLYEVSPTDPVTLSAVVAVLAVAALVACLAPALRARRVDPAELLRVE